MYHNRYIECDMKAVAYLTKYVIQNIIFYFLTTIYGTYGYSCLYFQHHVDNDEYEACEEGDDIDSEDNSDSPEKAQPRGNSLCGMIGWSSEFHTESAPNQDTLDSSNPEGTQAAQGRHLSTAELFYLKTFKIVLV